MARPIFVIRVVMDMKNIKVNRKGVMKWKREKRIKKEHYSQHQMF